MLMAVISPSTVFMIFQADATKALPIKQGIANLVYIDPPFNMDYNKGSIKTRFEYQQFTFDYMNRAFALMLPNSWMVICCGRYPTRYYIENIVYENFPDFMDHELIWYFTGGTYSFTRFTPSHEMIIVLRRGKPKFHKENVLVESWRQRHGDERADPRGRIPDDTFHIPRVTGNSKERMYAPGGNWTCQPERLCEYMLQAYTTYGDVVIDLFTGSGTMHKVAYVMSRRCLAMDINWERCKGSLARMDDWKRLIVETL